MRLRACIGGILLATGACAQIPDRIRVEVGDGAVEVDRCPGEAGDEPVPKSEGGDQG